MSLQAFNNSSLQAFHASGLQARGGTYAGNGMAWGDNEYYQIGDGTNTDRLTPVAVSGGHVFSSVSAGRDYCLGIDTSGQAWGWGRNFGRLGDGTVYTRSAQVAVYGGHVFSSVSAGENHSLGIDTSGQAWAWGDNDYGQLGNGGTGGATIPVAVSGSHVFSSVSAGRNHSLGIDTSGQAWAWGRNSTGQLGDGAGGGEDDMSTIPVAVSGSHIFSSVSAGRNHSLGIDTSGNAKAWGGNNWGQLGDGAGGGKGDKSLIPVAVSGSHTFSSISAGANHSLAVDTSGNAKAWGHNSDGQLGDGTTTQRITPVAVSGSHAFSNISAGYYHSLAILV